MMALVAESVWRRLRYTPLQDVFRGQLNGRLDWRYLLAEADLPAELADTISQVAHKTRLWNGERIDVVQELVAHFQDGWQAGRTAKQLAGEFGDIALAAKLIRRAKRRGRPSRRRVDWHRPGTLSPGTWRLARDAEATLAEVAAGGADRPHQWWAAGVPCFGRWRRGLQLRHRYR